MIQKVAIHEISEKRITLDQLVDFLKSKPKMEKVGIIGTLSVCVKSHNRENKKLAALEVRVDDDQTLQAMKDIASVFEKHELIEEVCIHLNKGLLGPKDEIMLIAVMSSPPPTRVPEVMTIAAEIRDMVSKKANLKIVEYPPGPEKGEAEAKSCCE